MQDFSRALQLAIHLILSGDSELRGIVLLSLSVSLSAAAIAFAIAAPLGAGLALRAFPGRSAVIVVINGLLGLPPVVIGLAVYILLSRSGPLGAAGLLFTPDAMAIAQIILTAPIIMALVHQASEELWTEYGDTLRVFGTSLPRSVWIILASARTALITAFLAAFGRAIAEVGAIIVVGGNIRGYTRTMTTAIALETSRGDLPLALALGIILIALTLAVSTAAFWLGRRKSLT